MPNKNVTKNYLVISAIGADKPGIVNDLSMTVMEHNCNIEDSRMIMLGGEFAVILLVSGAWNDIAKLEDSTGLLQKKLDLTITSKHTESRKSRSNLVPYEIEAISIDQPGIVYQLANFFSTRNINIEELNTSSYAAAHTGTPMFAINMIVDIPVDTHIAGLRDQFMDFCDEINLDAVIETVKR